MSQRRELVWRVTGTVAETKFSVGKKERPYWQVLVEVEGGFVCMYVRSDALRPVAEALEKGDAIEASGTIKPRDNPTESRGPVWLDPVEHLQKNS